MNKPFHDDEVFMARFTNNLKLEPTPSWTIRRQKSFPWAELAIAMSATICLASYWSDLRSWLFSLSHQIERPLAGISVGLILMVFAAGYGLMTCLAPRLAKDL